MIVSEVATRVKRQFGDESGVQVTDEDIMRWISDAQREIGQAQELIEATSTGSSTYQTETYDLPVDIINLRSVYFEGKQLRKLSMQEYDIWVREYLDGVAYPFYGTPEVFCVWANQLRMYPVPDASGREIIVYFTEFPTDVITVADQLSLPIKWHNRIVEYCLQQAYELDENFDAAMMKGGQMSQSLGQMAEDASWTEHTSYPMITIQPDDA